MTVVAASWDESKHPREPAGTETGGEFASKAAQLLRRTKSGDNLADRLIREVGPEGVRSLWDEDPRDSVATVLDLNNAPSQATIERARDAVRADSRDWLLQQHPTGRLTVYRGGEGNPEETLQSWTTERDTALFFAGKDPERVREQEISVDDVEAAYGALKGRGGRWPGFIGEGEVLLRNPGVQAAAWDESKHPREPKGSDKGGEFAPAGTRVGLTPADLAAIIKRGGPYGYHTSNPINVPAILEHGLIPQSGDDSNFDEGLGGSARDGQSYLFIPRNLQEAKELDSEQPLRVDLRNLDPKAFRFDEDLVELHPDWKFEGRDALPSFLAAHPELDSPAYLNQAIEQYGTTAYAAAIPPDAIERSPGYFAIPANVARHEKAVAAHKEFLAAHERVAREYEALQTHLRSGGVVGRSGKYAWTSEGKIYEQLGDGSFMETHAPIEVEKEMESQGVKSPHLEELRRMFGLSAAAWSEEKHPRHPKGSEQGGEFADKTDRIEGFPPGLLTRGDTVKFWPEQMGGYSGFIEDAPHGPFWKALVDMKTGEELAFWFAAPNGLPHHDAMQRALGHVPSDRVWFPFSGYGLTGEQEWMQQKGDRYSASRDVMVGRSRDVEIEQAVVRRHRRDIRDANAMLPENQQERALAAAGWDESKHPRRPRGSAEGGEFAAKDGGDLPARFPPGEFDAEASVKFWPEKPYISTFTDENGKLRSGVQWKILIDESGKELAFWFTDSFGKPHHDDMAQALGYKLGRLTHTVKSTAAVGVGLHVEGRWVTKWSYKPDAPGVAEVRVLARRHAKDIADAEIMAERALAADAWDESEHPREPSGSPEGGEFARKGGGDVPPGFPPGVFDPEDSVKFWPLHPAEYTGVSDKFSGPFWKAIVDESGEEQAFWFADHGGDPHHDYMATALGIPDDGSWLPLAGYGDAVDSFWVRDNWDMNDTFGYEADEIVSLMEKGDSHTLYDKYGLLIGDYEGMSRDEIRDELRNDRLKELDRIPRRHVRDIKDAAEIIAGNKERGFSASAALDLEAEPITKALARLTLQYEKVYRRAAKRAAAAYLADQQVTAAGFDESKHPRKPRGSAEGGEFAPKEWIEGPDPALGYIDTLEEAVVGGVKHRIRYVPSLRTEATYQPSGDIHVGPKFFALAPDTRRFVLAHELGHSIDTAVLEAHPELFDPKTWADADGVIFGGPDTNVDERIADAYASLSIGTGETEKERWPAFKLVEEYARRKGMLAAATLTAAVAPPVETVMDAAVLLASFLKLTGVARRELLKQIALALDVLFGTERGLEYYMLLLHDQVGVQAARLVTGAQDAAADVLLQSMTEGWTVPQTGAALEAKLVEIAPWQGKMLARTDLISLSNAASLRHAMGTESPQMRYKTWLATPDERTRIDHRHAHGQTVELKQPFNVGGEQLLYPGDPSASDGNVINCRCAVVYGPVPTGPAGVQQVRMLGDLAVSAAGWDEAKHPREPEGTEIGGQFARKETATAKGAGRQMARNSAARMRQGLEGAVEKLKAAAGKPGSSDAVTGEVRVPGFQFWQSTETGRWTFSGYGPWALKYFDTPEEVVAAALADLETNAHEVEANFGKLMAGKVVTKRDNPGLYEFLNAEREKNDESARWKTLADRWGVGQTEVVLTAAAAEARGKDDVSGFYEPSSGTVFLNGEELSWKMEPGATGENKPGMFSAGTNVAGLLRHEHSHAIWDRMTPESQREFIAMVPQERETLGQLTGYAAAAKEFYDSNGYVSEDSPWQGEVFAEAVAATTDPSYRPEDWPVWVNEMGEWVQKLPARKR